MSHFLLEMISRQNHSVGTCFSSVLQQYPGQFQQPRIGTPSGHRPGHCIIIHQRVPPAAVAGETDPNQRRRSECVSFGLLDLVMPVLVAGVSREPEEFPILR